MNTKITGLVLAILVSLLLGACGLNDKDASEAYTRENLATDLRGEIAQRYGAFELAIEELKSTSSAYCENPEGETRFNALQDKWLLANRAWQSVQTVNFGPVTEDNRRFTIAFYPVSKKTLEARLTEFLENSDAPVAPGSATLNSVSLKGLPALEYLLFRDDAKARFDRTRRHCDYLRLVSSSLADIAAELHRQWRAEGAYAAQLAAPEQTQAFIENLLNAINEHLSIISTSKLGKSLDGSVDAIESPYARQSLSNIAANFEFIRTLYGEKSKQGLNRLLVAQEQQPVADEMRVRLDLAADKLQELQQIALTQELDDETRTSLKTLAQLFHSVQEYNATKVADALGIFIGFNSADGD